MADNTWGIQQQWRSPRELLQGSEQGPLRPYLSAYPGVLWLHHHRQNYSGKRACLLRVFKETRNGSVWATRLSGYPQAPLPAMGALSYQR